MNHVDNAKICRCSERSAGCACIRVGVHDERGFVVFFGDASCDDTHNTFVIVGTVRDEDVLFGVYLFFGVLEGLVLEGFAMCVEVFEFLEFVFLARSSVEECGEAIIRSGNSSASIDSGADDKSYMKCIYRSANIEKIKYALE